MIRLKWTGDLLKRTVLMNQPTIGTMQMFSHALETMVTYTVIVPAPELVGPGPYPVLLQLHGYFDDHTAWLVKANLRLHVERLPLIVVLPSCQNYWWCDYDSKARYEKYVAFDLYDQVNHIFPVRKDSRWAIGGLSMGGLGALRLGLKFPDKFCSIYAHSSVIPDADELADWEPPMSPSTQAELNCYRLAECLSPATLPRLSFDCGTEDELLPHNRRFDAHLTRLKLPHQYFEYPGAHTWDYWDRHVQTALKQHAEVFNIQAAPVGR
jgi:putative tributyrin esterase